MSGIREGASGAEVVAALRAKAARRGMKLRDFVQPLAVNPAAYLDTLGKSRMCRRATIARVRELLAGKPVRTPPANHRRAEVVALAVRAGDPVPLGARVDRDPCFRCGVRGDIGCAHRVAPWSAAA